MKKIHYHPEINYCNKGLVQLGKTQAKSALSSTIITGNTDAGELIPPNFQFSTTVKEMPTTEQNNLLYKFMKPIVGAFGFGNKQEWSTISG